MKRQQAVIIGAGPAGLTAAFELVNRTDIHPVVLELTDHMGGISRTVNHNGNRIDIGGHRFFSKSERVMNWWMNLMPLEASASGRFAIRYQNRETTIKSDGGGPDPEEEDRVLLVRSRKSRIYFQRHFFDYPVTLNLNTIRNLGIYRMAKIGFSYMKRVLFPIRPEETLEDFFINRFGYELYTTFFKSYTEKVWGVSCGDISAEWGAQRIKGLSITRTLLHILKKLVPGRKHLSQKDTETSLIEQFLYPKFGPGQMWDTAAEKIRENGGEIRTGMKVVGIETEDNRISGVLALNRKTGEKERIPVDILFSTMPVKDLVQAMDCPVPEAVRSVSDNLQYRDFITVGLLVSDLKIRNRDGSRITDNWIYIQEPDVKVGRLQIFNNWSPHMVKGPNTIWIGLEYFCNEGDDLWTMTDAGLAELGMVEMDRIGILEKHNVLDSVVIRMPKTYPAYFGAYSRFDTVKDWLDRFENLFPVGRNGMHRYNNQDHSMLTAMTAVDNIIAGQWDKSNLWAVNTEQEYHEEK